VIKDKRERQPIVGNKIKSSPKLKLECDIMPQNQLKGCLIMQIDDTLLNKLEKLSALQINDEKREEIKKQLSEIVSFVDVLNELDLSSDEAVVSSIKGGTPLREDEPHLSDVVDEILKHAPSREGHFFAVPKIIE